MTEVANYTLLPMILNLVAQALAMTTTIVDTDRCIAAWYIDDRTTGRLAHK